MQRELVMCTLGALGITSPVSVSLEKNKQRCSFFFKQEAFGPGLTA